MTQNLRNIIFYFFTSGASKSSGLSPSERKLSRNQLFITYIRPANVWPLALWRRKAKSQYIQPSPNLSKFFVGVPHMVPNITTKFGVIRLRITPTQADGVFSGWDLEIFASPAIRGWLYLGSQSTFSLGFNSWWFLRCRSNFRLLMSKPVSCVKTGARVRKHVKRPFSRSWNTLEL